MAAAWAGFLLSVISLVRQHRNNQKDFDLERTKLRNDVALFWQLTRQAYDSHRASRPALPTQLSELIRQVGPIPNPPGTRDDPTRWRQENAGRLSATAAGCLEFVSQLYPARRGVLNDVAGGGLVQDAGFHQVRGVLAHFWENWGRRVSRRHLRRHHQDADELLSLLSWLEIALHVSTPVRRWSISSARTGPGGRLLVVVGRRERALILQFA